MAPASQRGGPAPMRPAGVFAGGQPPPMVRLSVWAKRPALRENRRMPTTVLVVDDHAGFRSRARLLLEAEGYEVVGRPPTAPTAIAEAAQLRPEVVLLDVQLPDLDGFEVAARLTVDGDTPAVVLTSSRDWSDSAELIARSGARGFVPQGPALRRGDSRGARLRSLRHGPDRPRARRPRGRGGRCSLIALGERPPGRGPDRRCGLQPADRLVVHRHRAVRLVAAAEQPLRRADDRGRLRLVPCAR